MSIVVRGVSKSFGPTQALKNVDFAVVPGEVHALVGENGSGKSTLMRIIHGEEHPDQGAMELNGRPYSPTNPRQAMDSGITLIHQELAVIPHLTVAENIFLGVESRKTAFLDQKAMEAKSAECLQTLGHPDIDPRALVGTLSPAQRQIVEIARAIRSDSKVVLFDEPTSSLGHRDIQALFTTIRNLKSQGRSVVYITHFLDEIKEVCDRATILRDGELVTTVQVADVDPKEIARLMTGRDVGQLYHRSPRTPGETVASVQNLSGQKLPKSVSLELKKGEVLGIAGLNGAGRTELVRCLFGLDPLKTGEIKIHKHNAKPTPAKNWQTGFGFVSEDRKTEGLALTLSLAENLTMPRPGKFAVSPKSQAARTQTVIEKLNVKCQNPGQKIQALSGGNQQKIAIGRLLDSDCDIMVLDEPTRGIDIHSKSEIYRIIDALATEGKSIIFISSQLPELVGLCDRIAVLRRGELVQTIIPETGAERELMELCTGA